jgi:hypothetical protein
MDSDDMKAWTEKIDGEHRGRARTLSELVAKLLLKRKGQMPKNFEELLQDFDIVKRQAEHEGACKAMNEMKAALWPSEPKP